MSEKKYQIFVSSTFKDLIEERQDAIKSILDLGHIPAGMEQFPAADIDQLKYIKKVIDECDYYLLIMGGCYGSIDNEGMSYTEREYDYAIESGKFVIAFVHNDLNSIPVGKSDISPNAIESLKKFRKKVEDGRLVKHWNTRQDLESIVLKSLTHATKDYPQIGWVRGDSIASSDALIELNNIRKENDEYRKTIGNLEVHLSLQPLPKSQDEIEISLLPKSNKYKNSTFARIKCSWISVFPIFYGALQWYLDELENIYHIREEESCSYIGESLASVFSKTETNGLYMISINTLNRLKSYYIEINLMVESGSTPFTEFGERVARRYYISDVDKKSFRIIEGSIKILDDDTPF